MADGGGAYKGTKQVMFRRTEGQIMEAFLEEVRCQ